MREAVGGRLEILPPDFLVIGHVTRDLQPLVPGHRTGPYGTVPKDQGDGQVQGRLC